MIRWLAIVACVLTVCITASSAFIRHSQAGLGCPSGAACERPAAAPVAPAGAPAVNASAADTAAADAAAPRVSPDAASAPPGVYTARALHRVSASLVGVLVLLIAVFGWSSMSTGAHVALVFALADTVFLAWLGRFTPHPVPLVTVANLVGGIALAAAFAWIAASLRRPVGADPQPPGRTAQGFARLPARRPATSAFAALGLLGIAAWVGTMIGAHEAIGVCADLRCTGQIRFDGGTLDPLRAPGAIDAAAARGLHWLHRVAGVAFAIVALLVALRARTRAGVLSGALVVLLVAQVALGLGTTVGTHALATATLHNAFAALLAVTLAAIAARPDA